MAKVVGELEVQLDTSKIAKLIELITSSRSKMLEALDENRQIVPAAVIDLLDHILEEVSGAMATRQSFAEVIERLTGIERILNFNLTTPPMPSVKPPRLELVGGMTQERYAELNEHHLRLTDGEVERGWHYCQSLGGLLLHTSHTEYSLCRCVTWGGRPL